MKSAKFREVIFQTISRCLNFMVRRGCFGITARSPTCCLVQLSGRRGGIKSGSSVRQCNAGARLRFRKCSVCWRDLRTLQRPPIRIENFDPVLPDLISGRAPELASYLVGEWTDPYPSPTTPLHQLGIGMTQWGRRWLASVRIRLFAEQENSPVYRVIVGELIESPALLSQFGLWSLS